MYRCVNLTCHTSLQSTLEFLSVMVSVIIQSVCDAITPQEGIVTWYYESTSVSSIQRKNVSTTYRFVVDSHQIVDYIRPIRGH